MSSSRPHINSDGPGNPDTISNGGLDDIDAFAEEPDLDAAKNHNRSNQVCPRFSLS